MHTHACIEASTSKNYSSNQALLTRVLYVEPTILLDMTNEVYQMRTHTCMHRGQEIIASTKQKSKLKPSSFDGVLYV